MRGKLDKCERGVQQDWKKDKLKIIGKRPFGEVVPVGK